MCRRSSFAHNVAMRFSSRVPRQLEPNSWALRLSERRASGVDLLDLTAANPAQTGLAPDVLDLPSTWTRDALARHDPAPRGAAAARLAIAGYYEARGHVVDPDHVVLTTSTSEAYAHLFRLLADSSDTILVPRPSYPLFEPLGAAEGVTIATYPLAWDGRWHVAFDDIESALTPRTRAIVVVQPNHPTGSCLSAQEQARFEALAARRGLVIVSDEVFGDYAWPAEFRNAGIGFGARNDTLSSTSPTHEASGLPSLVGSHDALTFVLSGLSKVCGLPQMKAGWIVAAGPAPARAAALERLEWLADLFLSVSAPTQLALPAWLETRHAFQRAVIARIRENLAQLASACARTPELSVLPADGGWVAVLRLPRRRSEEEWALELIDRGVIVHPGHFYDFELAPVAVVSLIVEPRAFARGVGQIEAALTST